MKGKWHVTYRWETNKQYQSDLRGPKTLGWENEQVWVGGDRKLVNMQIDIIETHMTEYVHSDNEY